MRGILIGLVLVHVGSTLNCTTGIACVDDINQKRLEYGTQHQIANMNELVYSEFLMKMLMAQFDEDGCPKEDSEGQRHRRQIYKDPKRPLIFEPDAEAVACVRTLCKRNLEEMFSFTVIEGVGAKILGPPGSYCILGRIPNKDGLCTPPDYGQCFPENSTKGFVRKSAISNLGKGKWISTFHLNQKSNVMTVEKIFLDSNF